MIVQVLDPWAIHGQLVIYASGEDMESELLLFSVLELGETFWLVVAVGKYCSLDLGNLFYG